MVKLIENNYNVPFSVHSLRYHKYNKTLNCQSEVRIFRVKNDKYPKFTLTKDGVIYIDISRFLEPEEAATDEVGVTLTG